MNEQTIALCHRCRYARPQDGDFMRCAATGLHCPTARFTACDSGQFFEAKPNTLTRLAEYIGVA